MIRTSITLLLFLFWVWALPSLGQNPQPAKYSRVTIRLDAAHDMRQLAQTGIELEHCVRTTNTITTIVSAQELAVLKAKGFGVTTLVEDVTADFLERNKADQATAQIAADLAPSCDNLGNWAVPKNWRLGNMGGHLNYDDAMLHLDSMFIKYPKLITKAAPISTFRTHENNPIYWMRLNGKAATADTTQPEVLFTALHHAREPVSLHQLVFFMWYLLENYGKDTLVTNLVDKTQIYFIPILNPDSYIENATQNPNGGGLIRKNRRPNPDGSFGVDLNRNYGKFWGLDNFGSSPTPISETYRGPEAFSEPETQAVRYFCEQHKFKLCLNYHTFANSLIFPTDLVAGTQAPDSVTYLNLSKAITKQSHYFYSGVFEALNYTTNGSSDDYMYFPDAKKPGNIFAWTPEVGTNNDFFWPVQSRILPLCQRAQDQNFGLLRAAHPWATFTDSTGVFLRAGYGSNASAQRIRYKVKYVGAVKKPATFKLRIQPIGAGHASVAAIAKTYSFTGINQEVTDSVLIPQGAVGTSTGRRLAYQVVIDNGIFKTKDTLYHYDGVPQSSAALQDNCDALSGWRLVDGNSNFEINRTIQLQGSGCLYDAYETLSGSGNEKRTLMRTNSFDLRQQGIVAAELSFGIRYHLARTNEAAALLVSPDSGTTWANSCTNGTTYASSRHTQFGLVNSDENASLWAGRKAHWSREYHNLADVLPAGAQGQKVWIAFSEGTTFETENGGLYIDDIRVRYVTPGVVTATDELLAGAAFGAMPNPFQDVLQVELVGKHPARLFSILGQEIALLTDTETMPGYAVFHTENLPKGLYIVRQGAQTVRVVK